MDDPKTVARLEDKLDKLTDAVTRLVLLEERQSTHSQRIEDLEEGLSAVKDIVNKFTYLVLGGSGVVMVLWTASTTVVKLIQ